MRTLERSCRITILVVAGIILAGCRERPARVPVAGQVLIDGQPLPCGFIRLIPSNARPSGGQIGSDGRFRLQCFEKSDGAVRGAHQVTVTAVEPLDRRTQRWHAPKRYVWPETSGLVATITGPTDSLLIELTWSGGAPFVEVSEGE